MTVPVKSSEIVGSFRQGTDNAPYWVVIGTEEPKKQYVTEKVTEWVTEVKTLSDITKTG